MATLRKPRCFVAMAFDHDDTNKIYDHAIKPVLVRNKIHPIIINRREDNRDINNQIIDQLNRADFCITDLTYTRPSVYFEAGYAQREIEVIYTVRSDHLKKNQPDELRVHFDLQMKPLIKWKNPDDPGFVSNLERRLKQTVLKKWKVRQRNIEKAKKAQEAFLSLSTNEKLRRLRALAIHSLYSHGFREWCVAMEYERARRLMGGLGAFFVRKDKRIYKKPIQHASKDTTFVARRRTNHHLSVASLVAVESLTMKRLRDEIAYDFIRSRCPIHLRAGYDDADITRIKKTEEHHIIVSLNNVTSNRIMGAMASLSFDAANNRYCMKVVFSEPDFDLEAAIKIPRQLYFYFLPKITSEPQFRSDLAKVLKQIQIPNKTKRRSN